MKIKFNSSKKRLLLALIFAVAAFVGTLLSGGGIPLAIGLSIPLLFVFTVSVDLQKAPLVLVWQAIMAFLSVAILQFVLGLYIQDLGLKTVFLNWLISLGLSFVILAISGRSKLTAILWTVLLYAFGLFDMFVILSRGNQISINDIFSIGTAMSVSGNYKLKFSAYMLYAALIAAAQIIFIVRSHFVKLKLWPRLFSLLLAGAAFAAVLLSMNSYVVHTWNNQGCSKNGTLLEFVLEARDSVIYAPDGYSKEEAEKIAEQYTNTASDASGLTSGTTHKPNIIAIMSESYCDLSVLGDLQTNIEVAPYFEEISQSSIHGYVFSSVYGANTANSEWEFLTGNSMAFLPAGSVVYQQYISGETNSLVSVLGNLGYHTVSMHPYYETGWNRTNVYQYLGFEESYFIDHFDQTKLLRSYITDEEFYEKIIDYFSSKSSEDPQFLFGISMQNHGGYTTSYDNFQEKVNVTNLDNTYVDVNQYLSLVHESDAALKTLIEYFKNYDEDTIIVFFGDHQPKLNSAFYEELNQNMGEEDKYKVPFFIWSNYDMEAASEEYHMTSINYLSTIMMNAAGIELPAYYKFLDSMSTDIQAINSIGFYSDNVFQTLDKANPIEASWMNQYWILQYANMFDNTVDRTIFNGIRRYPLDSYLPAISVATS